jgi:diaminopropionate ammonia-lyase
MNNFLPPLPFEMLLNPSAGVPGVVTLPAGGGRRARAEIMRWPGYAPTPLIDLPDIAGAAGLGVLRIKDETVRFEIGSIKALGGAYAVQQLLTGLLARAGVAANASAADLESGVYAAATGAITVACAAEGNHGASVAWGARRFGCRAVVFVHEGLSAARVERITRYGAEIRRAGATYDESVRACVASAAAEGWHVVAETSWPGYVTAPVDVMQADRLMVEEAAAQWAGPPPTHLVIQAGVGAVAASVSVEGRARFGALALLIVEPEHAACLMASAAAGAITSVPGELPTVMAGLACAEPSLLAWRELERAAAAFLAIPDAAATGAARLLLAAGIATDEAGAAGLGGLLLAASDAASREALGLGVESRVLCFATDGRIGDQAVS